MNFFQQQANARKQSRWIIIAFIGVTLLIVAAVDLVLMFVLSMQTTPGQLSTNAIGSGMNLFSRDVLVANAGLLATSSLVTGGIIGLSSLGKIVSLRSGGAKVARDMGGVLVTPDTRDRLRRRLYNVVEEIALASGTPVPEVYVMENEPGINAFAAGYSPADAAVAVTQGTLEKLSRSELQGVIAHEFSHILNGDMRINIRMMGVIFGIMVLAIIGRKFLYSSRHRMPSSNNKDNGASVILIAGLGLSIIGYIGLFFARWMKSALSRQREYLADASAVQFTREPGGIAGALKKIAAYSHSSYLKNDSEEVGHMLFGSGYRSLMFATHPPLEKRIQRLEKGFNETEIGQLAGKLKAQEQRKHVQAELAEKEQSNNNKGAKKGGMFDVNSMIDNIGNPEFDRIIAAALLTSELPSNLKDAARSVEWAPEVLLYSLLDENEGIRQEQLLIVTQQMGDLSEQKLNHLISSNKNLKAEQRLPLLEISFPNIKRRPISDIEKLLEIIDLLVNIDNKVDSFEYLLSRLVKQYLIEAKAPSRSKLHGNKKLKSCVNEITDVVSIIASHGQQTGNSADLQKAQKAFKAGMAVIDINYKNLTLSDNWQNKLDSALLALNQLNPNDKHQVVRALATTVTDDQQLVCAEHEMLRAVCSLIHVPLPILNQAEFET